MPLTETAGSAMENDRPWSRPDVVAGFVKSPPNDMLLRLAEDEIIRNGPGRLLDIGCGAGRNAVPLARLGWDVLASDLSEPMLVAAAERADAVGHGSRLHLVRAPMEDLPVATSSIDFVVAHGIWNLAPSDAIFRRAVAEAARVARPGAALFVFTFSRHTLAPGLAPVPGERFVFTEFSGQPQCFLTDAELGAEMAAAGFEPEPGTCLREYNRPRPGALLRATVPVIYEGVFRRRA
jgi:SAM-dependent methyltransferase